MHLPNSSEPSRREFLRLGTLGAAAALIGLPAAAPAAEAAPGKIPIGLELYSLRDQCRTDLPGMLKAVAKIGYRGVEFAGYWGRTAKELRQMLDDNGLIACGTHTPYESVIGDRLKETVEFNRTIGNHFLIVPSMDGKTREGWIEKANLFNEIAAQVKGDGMFVGYHAHAGDFKKLDGATAWDIFFGHTHPEVIMQLDTGNCSDAGVDPVEVLNRYPGRVRTIHMKAHGGGPDKVIGEDKVNWAGVFEFCEKRGHTQWFVVEHESGRDPLDAVRRSFEALRKMGKV